MTRLFFHSWRTLLATALLAGATGASAQSFSYLNVVGSSFVPRDSGTTATYRSAGCISRATGTNWFVYPLQLPEGSRIKYIRVYYNDSSAAANLMAALTRYDGAGTNVDEVIFTTDASSGFGSYLSPETSVVVNNSEYATQLLVSFQESSSTLQFCGMRVAYFSDRIFDNGFDG